MIYFFQYYGLSIFICFSILLSSILLILSFLLAPSAPDFEKSSAYECGFEPFGDSHNSFNLQFYIVGILFIIFDLEIAFMIPWSIVVGNLGIFGYWIMMFFLVTLTIGFVYEWKKGALNWN